MMFFTDGLSKIGSSPTRMAEILGCGLPVVANEGVEDVARTIQKYRVGVLVDGPDPDLPTRCRAAAEEIFSLKGGTEAYARIYVSVLNLLQKASKCVE